MYTHRKTKPTTTSISVNKSYKGETIEQKVDRIKNNKEPITDGAPLIYTERKDGVQAAYDIRTDRFELAVEATDAISKTHKAKREERIKETEEQKKTKKERDERLSKHIDELEKGWKKETPGGEEGKP